MYFRFPMMEKETCLHRCHSVRKEEKKGYSRIHVWRKEGFQQALTGSMIYGHSVTFMGKTLRLTDPQNSYRLEGAGGIDRRSCQNEIHFLMAALLLWLANLFAKEYHRKEKNGLRLLACWNFHFPCCSFIMAHKEEETQPETVCCHGELRLVTEEFQRSGIRF